jgi:uncharacterized protein (AIM24 family)/Tfp pilus assembly protein PilF
MAPTAPRAPFDQGLFLAHFNRGKALHDQGQHGEAERELEEAYLLRPRDLKVLNLLGLVYFKQEKFDKAEEVYRKLATESPEAPTLHYNLGLIYLKLGRLEESESAFLKALDLHGENAKINFYLGSIYEKQQRFQDAIFQYRQAGANLMVRRVEGKLAAAPPPAAPPPRPKPKSDDTAEYRASEIRNHLKHMEDEAARLFPPKRMEPVSPALLAPGASPDGPDTLRFRASDIAAALRQPPGTPPVLEAAPATNPLLGAPRVEPPPDLTQPPTRTESFRFLHPKLMEIDFSGKVFIKPGTIYSYSGNLTFWVKEKRAGGKAALVIVTGTGRLILTDRDREITFLRVEDETVFVDPSHLLACEEGLAPRPAMLPEAPDVEVLALEGRGMLALSVSSRPLTLSVSEDLPVSVPVRSVILWSGAVVPRLVDDKDLYEVMLHGGPAAGAILRLEGTGRLLVEQAPAP